MLDNFKRVYAIEPDPHNFAALETNLAKRAAILGATEVPLEVFNLAAGERPGWGLPTYIPTNSGATTISRVADEQADPARHIRIARIDDLAITGPVDLIKIDTQGAELNVLKGAVRTLIEYEPIVCVELVQNGNVNTMPTQFLGSLGYRCIAHYDKDFVFSTRVT